MSKILYSILIFALILYIDGIEVLISKDKKKIAAYCSIFFTVVILSMLLIMDIKIPNILEPVENFIVSSFGTH
jgi:O-antigen/teichoic acid export membrane protein